MKKPDSYFLQKSIIDLTNPQILSAQLNDFLAKTFPGRSFNNKGHKKIEGFFTEFEKKNEVQFEKQKFKPNIEWAKKNLTREFNQKIKSNFAPSSSTYQKWNNFIAHIFKQYNQLRSRQLTNYIWKKPGKNRDKTLIISANIDSVGQNQRSKKIIHQGQFFGANDNASGVIAVLELLKVLNKIELPYNVMVVFFDLQEFGNLGSYAFVNEYLKLSPKHIYQHINALMISKLFSSKNKNIFQVYGPSNKHFDRSFMAKASSLVPAAKINRITSAYDSSDAGPFIDQSIASISLIGLGEKEQSDITHQVSDTVESIDFYHYALGAKLLFSLTLSLLYPL